MRKRICREWELLSGRISLLCLCIFLTAFGGILMWVHGGLAAWVYKALPENLPLPGFSFFFLLWLMLYGLLGAMLFLTVLPVNREYPLRGCALCLLSYIFILAWYPLFFSVLHGFLALLSLLCAWALHCFWGRLYWKQCVLARLLIFFTSLLEIYFLCVTISFLLAK